MRSTTPPLYYKRPEGVPLPYYTAGSAAARDVPLSLRVPPTTTTSAACSLGQATAQNFTRLGSTEQATYGPQLAVSNTFPSVPSVVNPFNLVNPSPRASVAAENPADLLQQSAARWSVTASQSAQALSALEAEEASLLLEEQAMKAKLAELQLTRQRHIEGQLELSHGWAALLDREERYFTEPLVDLSEEIMAREHQCGLLHDQLQQAEAHLEALLREHQEYDAVVEEKKSLETEMQRVREGFLAVERRRKACRLRAELFFDAESKRTVQASHRVRVLDAQLKEMGSTGPLAEFRSAPPSRSTSRGVTFAQKSTILDGGLHANTATEEEEDGEDAGLTQGVGGTSVCLQNDEDDEDVGGIGGQSVAYSLSLPKRRRVEVPTA
ncbi:hypothetical protein TraAM80_03470 [Trypanosoma rangeli]|uniref:Kinetoplastid kinetochore protein 8 n=1 Tax=Trypanosoma rangeli TaxID=5698 RepID=A0A422NPB6_TRYRA|nr:uncharacterized protein TraAM80_03470 [Trypanosoma rangeli]RNF07333.1 hypothetical protein TraAM80_03470 [Trypanosoma rangeli]|eukprot:RNF07333.1 hypothetical protein TraAM80_03470 [Trypanosoma rangeli]